MYIWAYTKYLERWWRGNEIERRNNSLEAIHHIDINRYNSGIIIACTQKEDRKWINYFFSVCFTFIRYLTLSLAISDKNNDSYLLIHLVCYSDKIVNLFQKNMLVWLIKDIRFSRLAWLLFYFTLMKVKINLDP